MKKLKNHLKFKIGDRVRISLEKNIFEKGYDTNWTQEIFEIYDIKYSNVPYYLSKRFKTMKNYKVLFMSKNYKKQNKMIYIL